MVHGRSRNLLVALAVTLVALTATKTANAASPYGLWPNCTGGARAVETQSWWAPMAGAPMPDQSGHIHLGACFPLRGTLSEPVNVDVVVQLHNNPSNLTGVRWSENSTVRQKVLQNYSCTTMQCQLTVPLKLDPAQFTRSGWREIRFTADADTPDGFRMYNTTRWCINVVSAAPVEDYCGPAVPGRNGAAGWYSGVGYTNVYIDDATFPYTPVSGTWCFRAKFEKARGVASLDPAFHADPPYAGRILYDGPGNNTWRQICLDTTGLNDGVHTLHLRTEHAGTKPVGTAGGIYSIKFTVDNGPVEEDVTPPSIPGNFRATGTQPDSVGVAWNPATDDSGTVSGYKLYQEGVQVGDVRSGTTFDYTGLTCEKSYTFTVRAYDPSGNLGTAASLDASTATCRPVDETPPSAPTNVHATGSTRTSVTIAWDAATDEVGVTGYDVWVNGSQIANLGDVRTYTASLGCGTTYSMQVQARDAAGNNSALSDPISVATAACDTPRTQTITPDRDSWVNASAPTATTGGTATTLSLDGSPFRRAYLRFVIPAAPPVTATLRFFAAAKSSSGVSVAKATGATATTWLESNLSYNSAPVFGPVIATRPTVVAGWNEIAIPVAQLDQGAATTLVLTRTASTQVTVQSREAANPPQLVITS
jgi:chitodextrinase